MGKIRPSWGRLIFFRPFMHAGGCTQKNKTEFNSKNTDDFKKIVAYGIEHR